LATTRWETRRTEEIPMPGRSSCRRRPCGAPAAIPCDSPACARPKCERARSARESLLATVSRTLPKPPEPHRLYAAVSTFVLCRPYPTRTQLQLVELSLTTPASARYQPESLWPKLCSAFGSHRPCPG